MAGASREEPTYPAEFYARLFNLTDRRIQQLASDGVIPKTARGKYPLLGTVRGYVAFLQERALSPAAIDGDLHSNRNRLIRAQAEEREMKNDLMRREIAPFKFVSYVLGKISNEIRGLHDALPMECMKKLNLTVQEAEKIRGVVAVTADRVTRLSDRQWLERVLSEFNESSA